MATITYTIPDDKIAEFKIGFLKFQPVPLNENNEPIMTEPEWIKEWGRRKFIWAYKNGKHLTAQEAAIVDDTLVS